MNKRIGGVGMAIVLAVSVVLTGCKGNEGIEEETDMGAMGRYLEEELLLPEEDLYRINDITVLEDGTLRMAAEDKDLKLRIWDYKEEAWEENDSLGEQLPQVEDINTQFVDQVALDASGKAAVSICNMESEAAGGGKLYVVEADGTVKDLSGQAKKDSSYPQLLNLEFTGDGNLVAQGFYDVFAMYDGSSGEVLHDFDLDDMVTFSVVNDRMVVIAEHQVQLYDCKSGNPLDKDEVLNEQISKDANNLELFTTSSRPVVFTEGEGEDGIFYCTRDGIFSYNFGGNTVEKVVDGKLNKISSSAVGFKQLTAGKDNDFYLLAGDEDTNKIFHYVYSADTPTVPGTTLKVYSLKKDDTISKLIPMFQKLYPDIYVDYQVGMSGEDGVTVSDALKNLNTEVMADKGPDVFILDNMPVDSYVEKGLLADISDVIEEVAGSDGILENVKKNYEADGKIYVMPSRIGVPVMLGSEGDLEGITDLKTMADAGERIKAQSPDDYVFNPFRWGYFLVELWTDTCSPAWIREDGSVDEEALGDFYTQIKRIYDLDENPYEGEHSEEEILNDSDDMAHYYTGISNDLLMQYGGVCRLAYGTLSSMETYENLCAAMKEKGTVLKGWNGQAENCFVPNLMLGISAKCKEEETAKKFLAYLLSKEAQMTSSYAGFPVNQAAIEEEKYWYREGAGESSSGTSISMPDGQMIHVILDSVEIEKENADWLREQLKKVETPASYNYLIVDAVRRASIPYLKGETTLEEAVSSVSQKMNLYLTE